MLRRTARIVVSLWLLLGASAAAQEPARLALLIGNESYATDAGPLKNPKNDIALIKAALLRIGFAEANIAIVSDAGRIAMLKAFDEFAARTGRAGSGAVGFFYYSGHGAADEQHENYLIPVDVSELSGSGFKYSSVNLQDLLGRLNREAPHARHFVVFDACRNTLKLREPGSKALIEPKGFQPVAKVPGGMLIAFATEEGELASDRGTGAGPYARALAEELVKPGFEAITVFRNVQLRVSESIGQKPWTQNGPMAAVYFAGREMPPAQPNLAFQEWGEVKNSKDIAVLEAFRKQFGPDNPYLDVQAAQRIAALKAAKPPETQMAVSVPTGVSVPTSKPVPPEPACDGLLVSVAMGKNPCKPGSGAYFKDCPDCPEMVVVPADRFTMGSPKTEADHQSNEEPQHVVTFAKPFAVGRFAVTFGEWDACVAGGRCGGRKPNDFGWGRGKQPVVDVSWDDAKAYVKWLSGKTGKDYRLLSEAEREYVTRAGTTTAFWWDNSISTRQANYDGNYTYNGSQKGEYRQKTLPVKSFDPNPWGLYQVHGNVWEWVEDCWHGNYHNAPSDGSAWTTGECNFRVLRGGSWSLNPQNLRAAYRGYNPQGRSDYRGFRVALGWQDLNR